MAYSELYQTSKIELFSQKVSSYIFEWVLNTSLHLNKNNPEKIIFDQKKDESNLFY